MTSQQAITLLRNCEKTQISQIPKLEKEYMKVSNLFNETELKNLDTNKVCFFVEHESKFYDIQLGVNWKDQEIPKQSQVLRNSEDHRIVTIDAIKGG